jgi:hypothetical protein
MRAAGAPAAAPEAAIVAEIAGIDALAELTSDIAEMIAVTAVAAAAMS